MTQKKKPPQFEQAFLEKSFSVSIDADVTRLDMMLRSLKSLLVQTKVKQQMKTNERTAEEYLARLNEIEKAPLPDVSATIYQLCDWLRRGLTRVTIWNNGIPLYSVSSVRIKSDLIPVMDELTIITGDLCDILDIQVLRFGERETSWLSTKQSSQGGKSK